MLMKVFFFTEYKRLEWLGLMIYLIVDGFEAGGTALAVGASCRQGMLRTKKPYS